MMSMDMLGSNNRLRLNSIHSNNFLGGMSRVSSANKPNSLNSSANYNVIQQSGVQLVDEIGKFAFIHELDPKIFVDKDSAIADKAI